jgi:hypothetical protein
MLKVFDLILGIVSVSFILLAASDPLLPRREYFLTGGITLFIFTFIIYILTKQYAYETF